MAVPGFDLRGWGVDLTLSTGSASVRGTYTVAVVPIVYIVHNNLKENAYKKRRNATKSGFQRFNQVLMLKE